jgi:hypothetical protein
MNELVQSSQWAAGAKKSACVIGRLKCAAVSQCSVVQLEAISELWMQTKTEWTSVRSICKLCGIGFVFVTERN